MKRITLAVLSILSVIIAYTQSVRKPDFSMPKTVSKEAAADLRKAEAKNDAHQAINALIRLSVSESLIDPAELQNCIKTTERVAAKFKGDKQYGLFCALLAYLYNDFYGTDRWKYNQRELPLTPCPSDITEWSGDQFKARIKALCMESVSGVVGQNLKDCNLADYKDIIEMDELTLVYYPSLLDFAFQNACSLLDGIGSDSVKEVLDKALHSSSPDKAPYVLWLSLIEERDAKDFEDYLSECRKLSNNPYAGLIVARLGRMIDNTEVEKAKKYILFADEYITRFEDTPFKNDILNMVNDNRRALISINAMNYCAVGHPVEIDVNNYNAKHYGLDIYFSGEKDVLSGNNRRKAIAALKQSKPWRTVDVASRSKRLPFKEDSVLKVTFDKPGYYYVIPKFGGGITGDNTYSILKIRCLKVVPLVIKSEYMADVITVDPYSGSPIVGAKVALKGRKSAAVPAGISNTDGITDIFNKGRSGQHYDLRINVKGINYDFDEVGVYFNEKNAVDDRFKADVLTDRSIYHPGDSVDMLIVVSKTSAQNGKTPASEVCADYEIKVSLSDGNNQEVNSVTATTDSMGRAAMTFVVPTSGLTGSYFIKVNKAADNNQDLALSFITVSDYRMPEFEVKIDKVACDVPKKGYATIKGDAISYSGMPMVNATATLTLSETSWGWWRWNSDGKKLYSDSIDTDENGKFYFVVPDSVLSTKNALYKAEIDVAAINGATAEAATSFALTSKYEISLSVGNTNVDGEKPFRPDVKVTDPDGKQVDIPLNWALTHKEDTVASGQFSGEIDLSDIKPASYLLSVSAEDSVLADPAMTSVTVYNRASGIVPDKSALFVPVTNYSVGADGKADVEYATADHATYIYYCVHADNVTTPVSLAKADAGYYSLGVELPEGAERGTLCLYTVKDCKTYSLNVTLSRKKDDGLKIVGECFRDNLVPGANETWNISVRNADGSPVNAALALDMYNKALEALAPHSFAVSRQMPVFHSFIHANYPHKYDGYTRLSQTLKSLKNAKFISPYFLYLGGRGIYDYASAVTNGSVLYDSVVDEMKMDAAPMASAKQSSLMIRGTGNARASVDTTEDVEEEALSDDMDAGDGSSVPEVFDYRDSDVPMAIWEPSLTTDAQGNVRYSFTVPNANTTWRLRAVAWSKSMEIGALMHDFVASKPVMVQPNLPRFLRAGDEAVVLASVMNNTDSTQMVTTTVELFDPMTSALKVSKSFVQTIGSKQSDKVALKIYIDDDESAIGYRLRSTNGTFTDGEQNVIRILPSQASLIETTPFYLNPGDTLYSTKLPMAEDARISLTFSENPVWSIVSALPGLRENVDDYANNAASAIFAASVAKGIINDNPKIAEVLKAWAANPSDSALVSSLQKNEELKIALLNSTPWVQAAQNDSERMSRLALIFNDQEISKSINPALKVLEDLQMPDGGLAWGKWCKESSVWVTANVLAMLGALNELNWMPADSRLVGMIDKALTFYDRKVEDTDMMYCLVRPLFKSPISDNGRKVIKATLAEIRKDWKSYSDPAYKAMAAKALYINGDKNTALRLMKSVSEFGVFSKDQGLKFPSVNALYSYAVLLDAYATILPASKEVDGLRQQLIVRKQATDWGDATVTSEVVKAILSAGSCWTVDAKGAYAAVGNDVIRPVGPIETATGEFKADLSSFAGEEIKVHTSGAGPAYGAVYAQMKRDMDEVKAFSCDDLDIEKSVLVRRGTQWAVADSLQVGDRIKVQLTIHSKRNLQYVTIIDERPAAFEPVEQLPGWLWSEGIGFYRENRNSRTNLHVVYMRPGTYILSYEMNVGIAGKFSSGVASIQSQYSPEISAHSSGCRLIVGSAQ